jgi:hypothetical protein
MSKDVKESVNIGPQKNKIMARKRRQRTESPYKGGRQRE